MDKIDHALLLLCRHLLPSDPTLASEVALARADPDAHARRYGNQTADNLSAEWEAWYALLFGMSARGRLRSIDWRQAPLEVMSFLDDLLQGYLPDPDRWSWVDVPHWEEVPTFDFLIAIAKWLRSLGLSLVYLDGGSDSYPLIVMDSREYPRLKELAARAGYGDDWVSLVADAKE